MSAVQPYLVNTADGHDKMKCHTYMSDNLADWKQKAGYIGSDVACGLCQTDMSCEAGIPL